MQTHTLKKSKILKKMHTVFQQYASRLDKRVAMLVHKGLLLAKKYIKQATIYFNANYVKIKRITIRVIICAAIVDSILFVYLYKKVFSHVSVVEAAAIKEYYAPFMPTVEIVEPTQVAVGAETKIFLEVLTNARLKPVLVAGIQKGQVVRNVIILGSDNISVLEYPDTQTAGKEAARLLEAYNKNPQQYVTVESFHVYQKGTLVMVYVGTNETITKLLASFSGTSLRK